MTLETLSRPPVVDLKQFPQGEASAIKGEYIQRVMLPNGKEVVFKKRPHGRVGMPELLTSLIANDKTPTTVSQMYKNNTIQSERSFTLLGSKLRKRISQYGYAIRGVRSEDGEFGLVMEDQNSNKITLPDGTTIFIDKSLHKEVFQRLLKGDGVDAETVYGENNKKNEDRLNSTVTKLRKKLPSDRYAINSRRNNEGALKFLFETKFVRLPNGSEIRGLIPQDFLILQYFANTDLPIYLSTINKDIQPDLDAKTANHRMQTYISRINKALGVNGSIKIATKKRGSFDPAYMFVSEPQGYNLNKPPIEKSGDDYLQEGIKKVQSVLDQQNTDSRLALKDDVNAQLNNELQELKKEVEIRRLIEERKRAKMEEWDRKQHKSNKKIAKPEPQSEPEIEHPVSVKQTRTKYRYDGKGLTKEILDNAGYRALEEARKRYDKTSGVSFEEYAEFWIRGAMGNLILGNAEAQGNQSQEVVEYKERFAIALVDLSNRRKYCQDFVTPEESRALDIDRGITGGNPGSIEDITYELDCSPQWANRLVSNALRKMKNSPHTHLLAKDFSA